MDASVDIGRIRERTRKRSKALLGAQFRAEVGAFIAVGEAPFWARQMSKQLDIPENKVSAELSRFARQNLLTAISDAAWDRRTLYTPAPGSESYWASALDLLRRSAAEVGLETGIDGDRAFELYCAHVRTDHERQRQT